MEHIGPALEHHEWFPERTNVEFARVGEDAHRRARVGAGRGGDARVRDRRVRGGGGGERGRVGSPRRVVVRFRGGDLQVERAADGEVLLGGPVTHVFDGTVDPAAAVSETHAGRGAPSGWRTRTLELVAIASESREEGAVLSPIRARMPADGAFELVDERDAILFYVPQVRRPGAPFVVLAGHVDTVPRAGSLPAPHGEQGVVVGRGAADMKGAVSRSWWRSPAGSARGDIDERPRRGAPLLRTRGAPDHRERPPAVLHAMPARRGPSTWRS